LEHFVTDTLAPVMSSLTNLLRQTPALVLEIATYLEPEECKLLSATAKAYHISLANEYLWKHFSSQGIRGFRKSWNINQLNTLRHLVGIPSFREFYEMFRKIEFGAVGWFRLLCDHRHADWNGGLYCVKVVGQELVCMRVNQYGNTVVDASSFKFSYDEASRSIMATSNTYDVKYDVEFNSGIEMRKSSTTSQCRKHDATNTLPQQHNRDLTLIPLPSLFNFRQPILNQRWLPFIEKCLGLFTAPYGSHGVEIVHVSLHAISYCESSTSRSRSSSRSSGRSNSTSSTIGITNECSTASYIGSNNNNNNNNNNNCSSSSSSRSNQDPFPQPNYAGIDEKGRVMLFDKQQQQGASATDMYEEVGVMKNNATMLL